jgi:general secretion pathway protein D
MEKLDQPISSGQLSTFVYYIQNAEAEKLAGVLNTLFTEKQKGSILGGAPKPPTSNKKSKNTSKTSKPNSPAQKTALKIQGGVSSDLTGDIHIIPDVDTNSLIIRTEPKNYPSILEIIKKLDLLPQQVLIEVLILDLTLDDETRTGVEWALKGTVGNDGIDGGDKIVGGGGAPSTSSLGAEIANTATSLFSPGASFFVQQKDKFIGLLQAFASDSKVNIVANPILITSDNKEANISIADDIPIQSSTITTPTAGQPLTQSTIEFRSVGIKLGIVPKINSDNFVNLKIDQEISNLGPVFQGTPSFTTRTMKTEVVLKDNQVLVMGGLIRTTETDTVEGIPFLMDIPWLGRLFSTNTSIVNQTELMLFITPHIMSNTEDSNFVTEQFKKKLGRLNDGPYHEPKG